ncbi:hypothetical protein [Streptomyces sp. NPDC006477]|uniref:hypothetical protein n=1 Tax=Streptomyces sp. NPDC006477 TaxID=3364747 RepID=UPI0036800B44
MVSLTGTDFTRPERVAIGRLGPRGVTSIVFAVLAYVQLAQAKVDFVVNVTATTVLLRVVLHGVSAEPVARWFVRHPQPEARVPPPVPGRRAAVFGAETTADPTTSSLIDRPDPTGDALLRARDIASIIAP